MGRVTSDVGPFGIVPRWVARNPRLSDRAIRLYAVLADHADRTTGECWPTIGTLSAEAGCSESSTKRAIKELVAEGALSVTHRITESGDPTSNLYHVRQVGSVPDPPPSTPEPTGGFSADLQTRTSMNENHEQEGALVLAEQSYLHVVRAQAAKLQAQGRRSFDVYREVFSPAYDTVLNDPDIDEHERVGRLIGMACDYIAYVDGVRVEPEERRLVAKMVRQYGKAAMYGYSKALGVVEGGRVDRFRYARVVAQRAVREMTDGNG